MTSQVARPGGTKVGGLVCAPPGLSSGFMKIISILIGAVTAIGATLSIVSNTTAAETESAAERIGTYDSRVVAYAWFWSEAHQRQINEKAKAAKEAKAAGQTARHEELSAVLKQGQQRIHWQVFSTAPIADVLAEIKDRLPEIQKQAGVSKLVSQWDEATLKQHRKAKRVDVTDRLVQEFKPGETQLKVIADLKGKKPVPLDKIDQLENH